MKFEDMEKEMESDEFQEYNKDFLASMKKKNDAAILWIRQHGIEANKKFDDNIKKINRNYKIKVALVWVIWAIIVVSVSYLIS